MSRHFLRCLDCLEVIAVDTDQLPIAFGQVKFQCGYCGRVGLDYMGKVKADRLVTEHERCACDERCTCARGPLCSCSCGGVNHGKGLSAVIRYTTDRGAVPIVSPTSESRQAKAVSAATEYRAAYAVLHGEFLTYVDRRRSGEFLPRPSFDRMIGLERLLRRARTAKTHNGRMKLLREVAA